MSKGYYDEADEATTTDSGVFSMPDVGGPADPWAAVTAFCWLVFAIALVSSPAAVVFVYRLALR